MTRKFTQGSSATQRVQVHASGGSGSDAAATVVKVGASVGDYTGKPAARSYRLTVHGQAPGTASSWTTSR
ncbi:hypothetical protein QFZ74_005266 [Streptomyces sp. V3I7]|nr:DUF5110 domain-containing protein [Streptomyces sp. V3I7]MDQ0994038.1 hypothetical protein [Streptomyces sp. V3I7]